MEIMTAETFGPAHGVMKVKSDEEAIRLVSEARGYGVPEMEEQHRWLYGLADRAGRFDADSEPC